MTPLDKKELFEKLDVIIGLLAIQGKVKEEQIKILLSLKFNSTIIESITGIPASSVRRIKSTKLRKGNKNVR